MKWALTALLFASPLSAQRIDPDWCLTCADSRQHFAAGAGIDLAAMLVLPKTKPWQRLLITTAIGAAYEAGQADHMTHHGTGYGFGPKDLVLDVLGAATTELVRWALTR